MVDGEKLPAGQDAPGALPTPPDASVREAEAVATPRRTSTIWAVCLALAVVVVLALTVGAGPASLALAGLLAAAGLVRVLLPASVPGLVVRSRSIDLVMYLGLAAAVAFLAQTAQNI